MMRRPPKPLQTAEQLAMRTTLRNAIAYLDTHPEHTAEDVNKALAERLGRLARPLTEADVEAIRASVVRTRQAMTVVKQALPAVPEESPASIEYAGQAARELRADEHRGN